MKEITKNTVIGDILDLNEELAPYFLEIGMHCLSAAVRTQRNRRRGLPGPWCRCRRVG